MDFVNSAHFSTASSSSSSGLGATNGLSYLNDVVGSITCRSYPWPSLSGDAPLPLAVAGGGWSVADVKFKLSIDVYLISLLCAVGFIGNGVTVAVLRSDRDGERSSTNWLLQMLALVDTIYLAACIFIHPLKALYDTDRLASCPLELLYPYLEPYMWPIASISQTLTIWTVLLVTVDRYIAVCRPLKRNLRSIKRTKLEALIGLVLAIVYNVPLFFEREITRRHHCSDGAVFSVQPEVVMAQKTALSNNIVYFIVYKTICYFVFRSGGPLIAMIYVNVRLFLVLRGRRRRLRARCRRLVHNGSVTAMLVGVVAVFVVCQLPDVALRTAATMLDLYHLGGDTDGDRHRSNAIDEFLVHANSVTNALLVVNSSINFVIYCLVGTKFRELFVGRVRSVFCGRPCRRCLSGDQMRPKSASRATLVGDRSILGTTTVVLPSNVNATRYLPVSRGLAELYLSVYGETNTSSSGDGSIRRVRATHRAPIAPRGPTIESYRSIRVLSTSSMALLKSAELFIGLELSENEKTRGSRYSCNSQQLPVASEVNGSRRDTSTGADAVDDEVGDRVVDIIRTTVAEVETTSRLVSADDCVG